MHGADSGCMNVIKPVTRKPIRRAIRRALTHKAAAAVATAVTVMTVVQTVVITVGVVAWVGGSIPDYTKPQVYQAVKGDDGKTYVRDGVEYVPVQAECVRSGT